MERRRYISTNYMKAIAICFVIMNHTLNYTKLTEEISLLNKTYALNFWMYQGVSIFVVITGIHYAASFVQGEWYQKRKFVTRMLRFLVPYTIMFIAWMILNLGVRRGGFSEKFLFYYLSGGGGPGSYYTPIMFQILIIFPIIYYVLDKNLLEGIMLLILICICYELAVKYGILRASFNRLCCVRLLPGVSGGILIYKYYERLKGTVIPHICLAIGIILLLWRTYGGYSTQLVVFWINSSYIGIFYAIGIVSLVILNEDKWIFLQKRNKMFTNISVLIQYIGKASFHIFLFQQLYFCFGFYKYGDILGTRIFMIIDLFICIFGGLLFYFFESIMRKKFKVVYLRK